MSDVTAQNLLSTPWDSFSADLKTSWTGRTFTVDWKAYVPEDEAGKWGRVASRVARKGGADTEQKRRAFREWVRKRREESMVKKTEGGN